MDINVALKNYGEELRSHVLLILMALFFVVLSFGFICGSNTISLKVLYSSKTTVIEAHAVYDDPKGRDEAIFYSLKVTYKDPKGKENEYESTDELFQPNPEFGEVGYDIIFFNFGDGSYIVDEFQIRSEDEVLYQQKNPIQFSVSVTSSEAQYFSIPLTYMRADAPPPEDMNDENGENKNKEEPTPQPEQDNDNETSLDENPDPDGDGIVDSQDNCPQEGNDQADQDKDGIGDACDNCPNMKNPDQLNSNNDQFGDVCETASEEFTFKVLQEIQRKR